MERTAHYEQYLQILREELIPAMGCTEPVAIALAAAKARKPWAQCRSGAGWKSAAISSKMSRR